MSNLFKSLFANKKILIASLASIPVLTILIFYILPSNKESKQKESNKKIEFVFDDNYFGKSEEEMQKPIELDNSILIQKHEEEEEPINYEEPKEEIFRQDRQPRRLKIPPVISHKKIDTNNLDFQSNEENPSVTASRQYNLSRIITTNKIIPAVLETAINSEILGRVTAHVESNVYGYHAKDILIPWGSKVEGIFEKIESKNSRRMQVSWYKITTPEGRIITLEGSSIDSHGVSGLKGYLDQRLQDRYGAALLFSGINALANLSVDVENTRNLALVQSVTRDIGTITIQAVRNSLNVLPIIQIRQGHRFGIKIHQNIIFKEVSNFKTNAFFVK